MKGDSLVQLTIRVSDEDYVKMTEIAEREDRSINWIVCDAVRRRLVGEEE